MGAYFLNIKPLIFNTLHRRLIIARSINVTSRTETSIVQGDPSLTNEQPAPDETPPTPSLSTHWELHLSVTPTHGNRTLPVSSRQWKALRTQILLRDKLTCSSCGYLSPYPQARSIHSPYRQGRYMIVDHKDGDASNNDPSNLRVLCPPCDAIRHCGFAGICDRLVLGKSTMRQVEIVRKTREMFENTGVIPHPKDIDPSLKPAHVSVLELANMMLKTPWKDLPEEFQRLRGFFTKHGSRLFQDTMLTGKPDAKEPIDDSTEALSNKQDRKAAKIAAWKGRDAEEPYDDSSEALLDKEARKAAEIAASKSLGLPWIRYSEELHKSSQVFLDLWLPSETLETQVAWICVNNPRSAEFEDKSPDVGGLLDVWEQICDQVHSQGPPTTSKIDKLAKEFNVLCGKWLVFVSSDEVDNIWGRIAKATLTGTLGYSAMVSPRKVKITASEHVICVFNSDYTSMAEVNRVRDELRLLGVKERIWYKPDVYTHCGIYRDNIWGIPASRYCS